MRAGQRAVGLLAIALFAWWATADGGYAPGAWYPGALLLLAALVLAARPAAFGALPRSGRVALLALAAFTVWSFCSIAWADARGDAWDGANRTLLYFTAFALFALVPWTLSEAAAGLGAFALATAAVGTWAFLRALGDADPAVFVDGRMAGPIGYENATAALFLVAFWAAFLLAARPATPRLARAAMLATAGLLLDLMVLAESRGSLLAGMATLALAIFLARDRRALAAAGAAVAVATLAALPALLGTYDDATVGALDLTPAAIAIGLSTAALLGAGLALGRADRWLATRRWTPRPHAVGAAAIGLVVAAVALAAIAPDSRFAAGPGSGRYDFWEVAALELAQHPIAGVGADNFAHDYVRDRERFEEPLYPHSLALRAFAQLGIVGGALLATFLGAVALAVWRLPADDLARSSLALAALVAGAAWVAHGSIDWLWEMPAVGAPAMACLGLAAGLGARTTPARPARRLVPAACVAVAFVAAAAYALPALAARDVEAAVREWDTDRAGALSRLDRARDLNRLSDRPDLVAGALALRDGDRALARASYLAALDRDDRNWHPHVVVALLDLEAGRRAAAIARLERARALNPGEDTIELALAGAPPDALLARLSELAMPGPIERRPVDCRPVLGLGAGC